MVSNRDEKTENKLTTTKISKKLKNILSSTLIFMLTFSNKVMAVGFNMEIQTDYGVIEPILPENFIWKRIVGLCLIFIIPIIFLIGSIIGLKKIKNSKGKNFLRIIRIISIIAIIIIMAILILIIATLLIES